MFEVLELGVLTIGKFNYCLMKNNNSPKNVSDNNGSRFSSSNGSSILKRRYTF